ncbi:unnamed protein product [Protopolystoma xenopodis]|uniref:Uncharacterized protein n=1 Tax=Protopolystoma xenopodis TaxID=117903 RepID=A0A448XFX1_9PLAT|nr:unnamed protein product [Protopolystoma xenopodis]
MGCEGTELCCQPEITPIGMYTSWDSRLGVYRVDEMQRMQAICVRQPGLKVDPSEHEEKRVSSFSFSLAIISSSWATIWPGWGRECLCASQQRHIRAQQSSEKQVSRSGLMPRAGNKKERVGGDG